MLRNSPVIEILDAEIVDDLQQQGEVEKGEIQTVGLRPHLVLHRPVDPEDIKGLDQEVQNQQQGDVEEEFAFHRPMCTSRIEISAGETPLMRLA
ncbi:MAG: hypothetical protein IPG32_07610 [Saprospirales bacterium]|nr:hypothetical protein [Saprospirales bacterium]